MPWLRVDDMLYEHPKIKDVWYESPEAFGVHMLAMCYSAAHLRDGRVTEAFVAERIPDKRARKRAIDLLVENGLWEIRAAGGWLIHDYLEYNPSKAEVEAKRGQAKAAAAQGGKAKAANNSAKRSASDPLDIPPTESLPVSANGLRTPVPTPTPKPISPTRGQSPSLPPQEPAAQRTSSASEVIL